MNDHTCNLNNKLNAVINRTRTTNIELSQLLGNMDKNQIAKVISLHNKLINEAMLVSSIATMHDLQIDCDDMSELLNNGELVSSMIIQDPVGE